MQINFYGPFKNLFGPKITLELDKSTTIKELICILSNENVKFGRYFENRETDADLSGHIVFVKEGRNLGLNDCIENSDVVHVLLPATGG